MSDIRRYRHGRTCAVIQHGINQHLEAEWNFSSVRAAMAKAAACPPPALSPLIAIRLRSIPSPRRIGIHPKQGGVVVFQRTREGGFGGARR